MATDQLYFRNRPDSDVGLLQRDVVEYTTRLREYLRRRLLDDVVIGATETKVAHGQPSTPRGWRVFNQGGAGIVYQTRAADSRFLYLAALASFGSAAGAPSELFVRNDKFYCAGVSRAAGAADDNARTESNGTGAATAQYEKYVIAYPEVMRVDCTLASLGFYTDSGTHKCWAAVHANSNDGAGNDYPAATALASFEFSMTGFGGGGFRSGLTTGSASLVAGQKVWFATQINSNGVLRGFMQSSNYRPILGFDTPAALTATMKNFILIRSATAPAYAVGTMPAGGVLGPAGNDTIGVASGNTTLRPSVYFKLNASSAASAAAGGSIITGIEVMI